ncbi:MAG: hypothetical protein K8J08_18700 [Thermoanaerobaculia bacterium]|nr:hypothetical protein [Thermoanaerobaculia bacterium]
MKKILLLWVCCAGLLPPTTRAGSRPISSDLCPGNKFAFMESTHVAIVSDCGPEPATLWKVPIRGGPLTALSGAVVGMGVEEIATGTLSQSVAYVAHISGSAFRELFWVPEAGPPAIDVRGGAGASDVTWFAMDNPGSLIVFRDSTGALWTFSTATLHLEMLTQSLAPESTPVLTPDGQWIVFDELSNLSQSIHTLRSGDPRVGPWLDLDVTVRQDHPGWDLQVSQQGGLATFIRRVDPGPLDSKLYSVPLGGGEIVRLDEEHALAEVSESELSDSGAYVAYSGRGGTETGPRTLYVTPTAFSDPVQVAPFVPHERSFGQFRFAGSDARLLYIADEETDGVKELFSVGRDGTSHSKLNGPVDPQGIAWFVEDEVAGRVVFPVRLGGVLSIYSNLVSGGTPIRLHPELAPGEEARLGDLGLGPGFALLRTGTTDVQPGWNLFAASTSGTFFQQLSGPLVSGGGTFTPARVSPDSQHVVYVSTERTPGVYKLFVADFCLLCDDFEAGDTLWWHEAVGLLAEQSK